jgi:hypothetical protein
MRSVIHAQHAMALTAAEPITRQRAVRLMTRLMAGEPMPREAWLLASHR